MFLALKTMQSICGAALIIGLATAPGVAKSGSIKGRYAFRMTPAKTFSANAPGDPASVGSSPRQDILRVGVFTADEKGNLNGHTIATTDTIKGETWVVTFDWSGKYSLNGHGTGFLPVDNVTNVVCTDMPVAHSGPAPHPVTAGGTPLAANVTYPTGDAAIEGHEDYAFVFSTTGGKQLQLIETDNAGGGAKIFLTGTASAVEDSGNGDNQDHGNKNH